VLLSNFEGVQKEERRNGIFQEILEESGDLQNSTCERHWEVKKNPVGAIFFAHVQTGPRAHPAFCIMGTGSFLGVKRPGCDADHSPPSSAEVTKG
jgi:hypothetical protein